MLRYATWKLASVLALVAAAVLVILPSFMPAPSVDALAARLPGFIPLRQIVLGLDLQGGAYMLMEVDAPSVIKTQVESLRDDVRQKMRDGKIAISGGIAVEPRGVMVRIADPAERAKALELLRSLTRCARRSGSRSRCSTAASMRWAPRRPSFSGRARAEY